MQDPNAIPFWKQVPLFRVLLSFSAGIIFQWYLPYKPGFILFSCLSFSLAFFLTWLLPVKINFRVKTFRGILLLLIVSTAGMLCSWKKDPRNFNYWYGHHASKYGQLVLIINEPLAEKNRSFKTTALVKYLVNDTNVIQVQGKLLLYFSKDSLATLPSPGDVLIIENKLQAIKNSGNPGAFNYQRYAAFQQLYHQVYLQQQDYVYTRQRDLSWFRNFLFSARQKVVDILRKNIKGEDELAIAQALLIGYKEDLDKDLVQSYSNTGVVHLIAISGLHLGLIYALLTWILSRIPLIKKRKILKAVLLIWCLWMFALITGGSPSVLRSALMFTAVIVGKQFYKTSSIYNSLASSAFLLLVYNPYYLWDVGFQLSYLAVLGIVTLQQPIYRLWYIPNIALSKTWQLFTVSLSAQIATFPLCLYYFHQFPNLFFISNLVAVPLATIILYLLILLLVCSPISFLAQAIGWVAGKVLWVLNGFIQFLDSFSFSVWDNIYATPLSTWILYFTIIFVSAWFLHKHIYALRAGILCIILFTFLHTSGNWGLARNQKLVIYNVPRHKAIDFIYRNAYYYIGDSALTVDGALRNFHLKPARIFYQATSPLKDTSMIYRNEYFLQFMDKKVLLIDSLIKPKPEEDRKKIDVLLISKNPGVKLYDLVQAVSPSIVVFDASNSLWKIAGWKKECEQLALPFHSIPEQGAFVLDIQ